MKSNTVIPIKTKTFYKQCRLKKGKTIQVAYIPQEYAQMGKYLKIKGENGWQVVIVYHNNILSEEEVAEKFQNNIK